MAVFLHALAASYVGVTLLISGGGHAAGMRNFAAHIQAHGLLPLRLRWPTAVVVTLAELSVGVMASYQGVGPRRPTVWILGAVLGCLFLMYLIRLLQTDYLPESCGCSVVESALTPFSTVPAAGLVLMSLAGWAGGMWSPGSPPLPGSVALGTVWGATLAGLVVLFPAMMPEMHKVRVEDV